MIDVYYLWNDREWSPGKRISLAARLSENMQERANRFRRWQDAQAYIAGKLLLARLFHIPSRELTLSYTANSRPFIRGACDFNISHSGALVVIAVGGAGRIGIDIESEGDIDLSIYQRLFSTEEWNQIVGAGSGMARRFYESWTQKEAVLKADGCGLIHPMNEVRLCHRSAWFNQAWWNLSKLDIAAGYACHLAMEILQPVGLPQDLSFALDLYEHEATKYAN